MQRDRKLGRGLGQLLGGGQATAASPAPEPVDAGPMRKIAIDRIDPNPWQPRATFDAAALEDLVNSIRTQGLLQPITVRARRDRFQLVAGERRVRACRELGMTEIDAVVREVTDQQMLEWAILENLQRSDLDPIETARSFRRLIDEFTLTQDEAARRLGQSRAHVANTLRLLELPGEVLELVSRGTLAPGAARALIAIPDRARQISLARKVATDGLSVRQVEDLVRDVKRESAPKAIPTKEPNRAAAEDELQQALGTKVRIEGSKGKGVVKIAYHSERHLNELFKKLVGLGAEA